jgi:urea transport system permease protein
MTRILVVLACLLGLAGGARAATLDDALQRFASTKFDDIESAIEGVAASGEPQAEAILEALSDGRLLVQAAQRRVFIKEPGGGLLEAATGATAPADVAAAALKPVRVNGPGGAALARRRGPAEPRAGAGRRA